MSALRTLKAEGWTIVATVIDPAAEPIYQADLCQPKIALLFGNEKTGLSSKAISLADKLVTIPMLGIAQSMNISVSAALAIYEVTRQRRERCPGDPKLGSGRGSRAHSIIFWKCTSI